MIKNICRVRSYINYAQLNNVNLCSKKLKLYLHKIYIVFFWFSDLVSLHRSNCPFAVCKNEVCFVPTSVILGRWIGFFGSWFYFLCMKKNLPAKKEVLRNRPNLCWINFLGSFGRMGPIGTTFLPLFDTGQLMLKAICVT